MLRDMKPGVPSEPLVDALAEAPVEFYLTGSHYFQCARPDSDIDFMTQDNPQTRSFLLSNGFYSLLSGKYVKDSNLTAEVMENGQVQVQLCHDVDLKRRVRDSILANNAEWHLKANRTERNWLWNRWAEVLEPAAFIAKDLGLYLDF